MLRSINCATCGAPVEPGTRFCQNCGADVSGQQGHVATAHVPRAEMVRATMGDAALLDALRDATLGEYEILAELGRGGMATVFLAHDLSLDRKVAIKVMAPALLAGEGMVERFKREARTSAQLSHPHIIPIFAVRQSENLVYFVMKYIEGRSLESIIKELGPLPIPMAQSILQQVGSALAYAHRRGVIHRDIKPGNIMIDAEGWSVVTDFGIAKVSEARGLTMTGATVGTPTYMSPEQCAAKDITPASDQYSFGIVAYEMFSGSQPFTGDSIMAIMYQHFNEPPPSLRASRPDCPPEIEAAVMRMLEKEPTARFPDLDQAAAAIGGVPLAPDDPIRTRLMTIVASGAKAHRAVTTPRSPMPAGRTRPGAKTTRAEPTTGMSLSPARVMVAVGGSVQLTASRRTGGGATLPGDALTWASTNTDVATVDDNGLVTAVAPGQAVITATMGAVGATGTVTVTPARAGARRLVPVLGIALLLGGGAVAAWRFGPWGRAATPATEAPVATGTAARQPSDSIAAPPPAPTQSAPPVSAPAQDSSPVGVVAAPAQPRGVTRPPRRTVAGAAAQADTVGPRLLAEAQRARSDAVLAGATEAELATGDALVREARQLVQDGRRGEALARFNAGLAAWTSAAQAGRARTAAAAAPSGVETPPPVTAPPPAADPRPQIEQTIAAYARALESRDVNAVRRVYPGLTRSQEDAWRGLFQSVREVRADLRPSSVQVDGPDAARAAVAGTLELVSRDGRQRQPITFQASFERGPAGWLIREIR